MRNLRLNLIFFFILLFSAAIISRLFFIQVLQNGFYKALAEGLHTSLNEVWGERGEIFFKNGEHLAININWPLVFASPREIEEKEKTAQLLAEVLTLDENSILEKFKKDNLYVEIKDRLTKEEVASFEKLNLAGVYLSEVSGRYYPQELLASQVIGFLDKNQEGQYGLEGYYEKLLQGEIGFQEKERAGSGYLLTSAVEGATKGSDLILTLDYHIQFKAEELLKEAEEELGIEGGEIIVLDPNSGEVMALANFPNFNPNQYNQYAEEGNLEIFQNGATQKIFEPGSVFKPITFAIALDQGKITPQTTYTDPGIIKIGGWPIYNYEQRTYPGEITMTEVLEKSINTGAVFVEKKIPHNVFLDYLTKFGIFEATGIDLEETYSLNEEFKNGYEINFATASFGQGIEMTPIQLARAYCVIANGGELVTPYLVENEETFEDQKSSVISQKTASQLTAMLVSVVENGFAKSAQVPGYYIAGKTGTAQVPLEGEKGYCQDRTIQSFVGYAPAFNPQFLILVKLNNPKAKTAEYSAVPIFHDLAKYIIDYYQIPPDYYEGESSI